MKKKGKKVWFKFNGPLGKGFRPVTRQGWSITIAFIILLFTDIFLSSVYGVLLSFCLAIVLVVAMLVIWVKHS